MKSTIASWLLSNVSSEGDIIHDPFCGAGTVALEAVAGRRNIIAGDLSPLAVLLTKAKLFPNNDLESALNKIKSLEHAVQEYQSEVDLRQVPKWVRSFYHQETLRETISWVDVLKSKNEHFLLACLLGILHHQRPGFLSYPSSHAVPYLRTQLFPKSDFPKYYEYRDVKSRLTKKVIRAYRRTPETLEMPYKICRRRSADTPIDEKVDAIITSPPYMRQLDYARDNRLRLWFLGHENWKALDEKISPSEDSFLRLMRRCFKTWNAQLKSGGICAIVIGDSLSKQYSMPLHETLSVIATKEIGGYSRHWKFTDLIPDNRRIRRHHNGSESETIILLKKE